jgi:DNA-binding CsgD family transcriptional regulator
VIPLTPRQREVVALVRDGLTYVEIGARLGISGETARAHVNHVANRNGITKQPYRWVMLNAPRLLAA